MNGSGLTRMMVSSHLEIAAGMGLLASSDSAQSTPSIKFRLARDLHPGWRVLRGGARPSPVDEKPVQEISHGRSVSTPSCNCGGVHQRDQRMDDTRATSHESLGCPILAQIARWGCMSSARWWSAALCAGKVKG